MQVIADSLPVTRLVPATGPSHTFALGLRRRYVTVSRTGSLRAITLLVRLQDPRTCPITSLDRHQARIARNGQEVLVPAR
jgi:hypothetical protein